MKPETQQMGQKIAGGLAQRVMARLIREVLLQETQGQGQKPSNGSSVKRSPKLVLPPAAAIH